MSEQVSDVEVILREIKERVQQENLSRIQNERRIAPPAPDPPPVQSLEIPPQQRHPVPLDLSYLQTRLATIDRTRSNLPPLVSHRNGFASRAELFVKRQVKRMTKWFIWDQLTFNTAVYESLLELHKLQAQSAEDHARLRDALAANTQEHARLRESIDAALAQLRNEIHKSAIASDVEKVRSELQKGIRQVTDEQAVVYKNILIQIDETAAVADRSRRALEERIAAFERESVSS